MFFFLVPFIYHHPLCLPEATNTCHATVEAEIEISASTASLDDLLMIPKVWEVSPADS